MGNKDNKKRISIKDYLDERTREIYYFLNESPLYEENESEIDDILDDWREDEKEIYEKSDTTYRKNGRTYFLNRNDAERRRRPGDSIYYDDKEKLCYIPDNPKKSYLGLPEDNPINLGLPSKRRKMIELKENRTGNEIPIPIEIIIPIIVFGIFLLITTLIKLLTGG